MITMISAVLVGFMNAEDISKREGNPLNDADMAWQVPGMTLIFEAIVEGFLLLRWLFKKIKK